MASDFFQIGIDPETRIYLFEDYVFVNEAHKLGFETYLVPWPRTIHSWSYKYVMDFPQSPAFPQKPRPHDSHDPKQSLSGTYANKWSAVRSLSHNREWAEVRVREP
jgi:hypothetical protein